MRLVLDGATTTSSMWLLVLSVIVTCSLALNKKELLWRCWQSVRESVACGLSPQGNKGIELGEAESCQSRASLIKDHIL